MAVSGLRSGGLPLFHHHHHCHHLRFLQSPPSFVKFNVLRSKSKKGFTVFARYAQARDLFSSRRFQGSVFLHFTSTRSLAFQIERVGCFCCVRQHGAAAEAGGGHCGDILKHRSQGCPQVGSRGSGLHWRWSGVVN